MPEIATIAVIRAGELGRSIAYLSALAGYRTILEDLIPPSLRNAEHEMRTRLDQAAGSCLIPRHQVAEVLPRIEYAGNVEEASRPADLVIESVPDEMDSKIEIFTLLDKICRPATILASTSSVFSVSELAGVTFRPRLCLAMRFCLPISQTNRLEIVHTRKTDPQALEAVTRVGGQMCRQIAVVCESEGTDTAKRDGSDGGP